MAGGVLDSYSSYQALNDQPQLFEALLRSLGQESLLTPGWMTSREQGDGALSGITSYEYSQPVMDLLSKYQFQRTAPSNGMRQYTVIDPATGKTVYESTPWKQSNWYDPIVDAAPLALGMAGVLGVGSLLGGATAGTAAAAAPESGLLGNSIFAGNGAIDAAALPGLAGTETLGSATLLPSLGGAASASTGLLGNSIFGGNGAINSAALPGLAGSETLGTTTGALPSLGAGDGLATAGIGGATGTLGSAASGLFDFIKSNPNLIGTLVGGLLGGGMSGGKAGYDVGNRTPLKPLEQPKFTPRKEDYGTGLPSGLGNQSAGLFADYMRRMGG